MAMGITLLIIAVSIIGIYVLVEFKRFKHKMFAIFLIAMILFFYLSAVYVFKGKDLDMKTIPGVIDITKVYFSWLFSIFGNVKSVTSNAVKMDWGVNESTS